MKHVRIASALMLLMLLNQAPLGGQVASASPQFDPAQPLGSFENPVRTQFRGQPHYLGRLRCPDGQPPHLGIRGNVGIGVHGNITDVWSVDCAGVQHEIYMDHYHADHVEEAPVPGFEIVSSYSKQLIARGGLLYKAGSPLPHTGTVIDRYENETIAARTTVREGHLHGEYAQFSPAGQLLERLSFANGRLHGRYELHYHPNGVLSREGAHKDGRLDGVTIVYDENGQRRESATYERGQLHGERVHWDEQGHEIRRGMFRRGQPIPNFVSPPSEGVPESESR